MRRSATQMPPKRNTRKDGGALDQFQTPPEALAPLLPHIPRDWHVWEPACGQGNLVRAFLARGNGCTGTDILTDPPVDFLRDPAPVGVDVIVTNPPYSIKTRWIRRCYELDLPFALLLPLTALEGMERQGMYRQHGLDLILFDRRINFQTPSGTGGGSWFATAWFTWRLGLEERITFARLPRAVDPAQGILL